MRKILRLPGSRQKKERRRHLNNTKYVMFKNNARKKRLRFINGFLRFFEVLAIIAVFVFILITALAPAIWVLLVFMTLGLILLSEKNKFDLGQIMRTGLTGATISLIAVVVLFLTRWIFEWVTVLAEFRELKKQNSPENEKYIKVATAVRKAKVFDLFLTIITVAVFAAACAVLYLASDNGKVEINTSGSITMIVIGVTVLGLLIFKRIKQVKIFSSVEKEVADIQEEQYKARLESKQAKKEAKR